MARRSKACESTSRLWPMRTGRCVIFLRSPTTSNWLNHWHARKCRPKPPWFSPKWPSDILALGAQVESCGPLPRRPPHAEAVAILSGLGQSPGNVIVLPGLPHPVPDSAVSGFEVGRFDVEDLVLVEATVFDDPFDPSATRFA